MSRLTRFARQIKPFQSVESFSDGETLRTFVWRSSGMHQLVAGMLAVVVTSLILPVELLRRIVDLAAAFTTGWSCIY